VQDPNGNGSEFWRGKIDARLDNVEEDLNKLWDWRERVSRRITTLETKVAGFAAVGAAAGAVAALIFEWFLKKL
jgi:cell division septum initiation protein DivIVA